jgi:N utilization substance protein B
MISRRQIRIKAMQALYGYFQDDNKDLARCISILDKNLRATYELYVHELVAIEALHGFAKERIEKNLNKMLPTDADLNPNRRFIENPVLLQLFESQVFEAAKKQYKSSWADHADLIRKAFLDFSETPTFISYMAAPEVSFAEHKDLVKQLYGFCCVGNESMYQVYEAKNIFWADDLHDVQMMVNKTLKSIKEGMEKPLALMPLFKDDEDREFGPLLLRKTIQHASMFEKLISEATQNWEMDRIALMDLIFMRMALAEVITFQEIPVRVSLNEYIELSKLYSTPKSGKFINGVLDKLVAKLEADQQFVKIGRGLL